MKENVPQALAGQVYFKFHEFDAQLLRSIGHCHYGGPSYGECMATAMAIEDGSFESWYRQWWQTAQRLESLADACAQAGHLTSAGKAYLRASECYRQSDWFLRDNLKDVRLIEAADGVRRTFLRFAETLSLPIEAVEVPYEETTLPGYLWLCEREEPRPTIILPSGYDAIAEENLFGATEALERGYHVFTFDGPGQGHVLRRQGLPMRPDWENVLRPVVDFLTNRPEVGSVVLMGRSFAGFLAPRGAAFEPRLAALICDPGHFDLYEAVSQKFPANIIAAIEDHRDEEASKLLEPMTQKPGSSYFFDWRCVVHGASSLAEYVRDLKRYSNRETASKIACPTLLCSAEAEDKGAGGSERLFEALTCPKSKVTFRAFEGAADHVEMGSPQLLFQRALDWLDETLESSP